MTGVNVGVDEAGQTSLSPASIMRSMGPSKVLPTWKDVLAFVDDHAVAQQRVSAAVMWRRSILP